MANSPIARRLFAAFSRYRPSVLTLAVLAAIAGMIAMANLSEEYSLREVTKQPFNPSDQHFDVGDPDASGLQGSYFNISCGWPLLWRQHVLGRGYWYSVVGEYYSASRLAGNLAIWLSMLAAPAGLCEWLVRRYRPRVRFSLRTMLAVIGLAAALFAWCAATRNRANVQDPLIDAIQVHRGKVWVERWGDRWGPKWLDLLGVERYRRRVVGVRLNVWGAGGEDDDRDEQSLLSELKRLPHLRYLSLEANRLTPEIADALSELRRLESLQIDVAGLNANSGPMLSRALGGMLRLRTLDFAASLSWTDRGALRNCLEVIGKQRRLERLRLERLAIDGQDLAALAELTNLKSLTLEDLPTGPEQYLSPDPPLLSQLPALPRLETLDLTGSLVGDDDLPFVAAQPRLKVLNLGATDVTGAGLARLKPLARLEELTIDDLAESPAGCEAFLALKRLKTLHLPISNRHLQLSPDELRDEAAQGLNEDFAEWLRALAALRESKPRFAIDGDVNASRWDEKQIAPQVETNLESSIGEPARQAVKAWKEKQAGN